MGSMFPVDNKIYVRIDSHWFDLTNYKCHPGGLSILRQFHLHDATNEFNGIKGHGDGFVEGKLTEFEIKNAFLVMYLNLIFDRRKD
jgi:cytochrome b involved in lipid metabolism